MLTLTARACSGEADLQAIADFLNACETVDQENQYYSVTDLRLELTEPGVDPSRDFRLWEADGRLIAFSQMWIPQDNDSQTLDGFLWFRIHPDVRGTRLDTEVIAWGERRIREAGQERQKPVLLRSTARNIQSDRIRLLEEQGFQYERCFFTMTRSLNDPLPTAQLPERFTLRQSQGESELEAWVELHNQSFVDHWNFHPLTVEMHRHWLTAPGYQPELDLVAIAPNGQFAAFCYCHIDLEANQHKQRNEGWIGMLGTHRQFRRRGLGRAMLLSGMQRLKDAGIDTALLGVDTENPNCAQTLYESVGFQPLYTRYTYVKSL